MRSPKPQGWRGGRENWGGMTRSRSTTAGIALAFVVGDLDDGAALIDRALVLNPNLAWAWFFSGWVKVWLGEPEVAIEREARAMRLSPHDPQHFQHAGRHRGCAFLCRALCRGVVMGGNVNPRATGLHPSRHLWRRPALRSPGTTRQRRKPWRACVNSCPSYAFPISRTCSRSGDRKISIDGRRACEKPGCRNRRSMS